MTLFRLLEVDFPPPQSGSSEKAVDKALELIGEWKTAFGDQTGYKAINTVFGELEREGYHIPISQVASAAFIKKAPEWLLKDHCFMCRQEFNRFKGKLRVSGCGWWVWFSRCEACVCSITVGTVGRVCALSVLAS